MSELPPQDGSDPIPAPLQAWPCDGLPDVVIADGGPEFRSAQVVARIVELTLNDSTKPARWHDPSQRRLRLKKLIERMFRRLP